MSNTLNREIRETCWRKVIRVCFLICTNQEMELQSKQAVCFKWRAAAGKQPKARYCQLMVVIRHYSHYEIFLTFSVFKEMFLVNLVTGVIHLFFSKISLVGNFSRLPTQLIFLTNREKVNWVYPCTFHSNPDTWDHWRPIQTTPSDIDIINLINTVAVSNLNSHKAFSVWIHQDYFTRNCNDDFKHVRE